MAADGWISVFWRHLDRVPTPFGELAWDHARRQLVADGGSAAEEQIAEAVAALLRRAHHGPAEQEKPKKLGKRDRRVAARTTATTATAPPAAPDTPQAAAPRGGQPDAEQAPAATASTEPAPADGDTPLAKVIPLGIFDPFVEADEALVTALEPVLGADISDDSDDTAARQLTTLKGWRAFVAQRPRGPATAARDSSGGPWARTTGSPTTRRGWRTTRDYWWWPPPPSSR